MGIETIAPGITLIGRFGWLGTGVWILEHNYECILLEMPDSDPDDSKTYAWDFVATYLKQNHLTLKFMTCSHAHGDHVSSYLEFHHAFPHTPIVWHQSFFEKASYFNEQPLETIYSADDLFPNLRKKDLSPSIVFNDVPIYCYKEDFCQLKIGNEPFFMIHAPKHSRSDTMMIFRGCMISGDWWLGPGDPNPNHVPETVIQHSIDTLLEFTRQHGYYIHSVFSVHANEFRLDINFEALMAETRKRKH